MKYVFCVLIARIRSGAGKFIGMVFSVVVFVVLLGPYKVAPKVSRT